MKKFFRKIWAFLTSVWDKADDLIERIAPVAIHIVNQLKNVNESTAGDIIEFILSAAIPGSADEKIIHLIRERLKIILPKILKQMNIAQAIANIEDPNEQLKAIINAINMSPDETKNVYYHSLCALIVEALGDGHLTWSESIHIAEYYYQNIYKPARR